MSELDDVVYWDHTVSAELASLPTAMSGVTVGIGDDGAIWEEPLVVLGVLVKISDQYRRERQSKSDRGEPHFPVTAAALARHGYTFVMRNVVMVYVVHDDEYGPVEGTDEFIGCANTRILYFPTVTGKPSDQQRDDAERSLKAFFAKTQAAGA